MIDDDDDDELQKFKYYFYLALCDRTWCKILHCLQSLTFNVVTLVQLT